MMMMSKSCYPLGYRFLPTDSEIILHLKNKLDNGSPLIEEMKEIDLSKYDPKTLSVTYPELGDKQWYFFTSRNRKYRNGSRPDRSAGDGFWKATGADQKVKNDEGDVVGFKKTLVYYKGPHHKSFKTNWIMHEFRVNQSRHDKIDANDMKLDDWVLCRIHEKVWKSKRKNQQEEEEEEDQAVEMNSESSSRSPLLLPPTPALNYESQQLVTFEEVTPLAAESSFVDIHDGQYHDAFMNLEEFDYPLPDFDRRIMDIQQPEPEPEPAAGVEDLINQYGINIQQSEPLVNEHGGFDHRVGVGRGLSNQYENLFHQGVGGEVSKQYETFQQGGGGGGVFNNQYHENVFDHKQGGEGRRKDTLSPTYCNDFSTHVYTK